MTSDRVRRHRGEAELNRRRLLGGALGLAGGVAVGGRRSLAAPAAGQDAFDWKRFEGSQIRLLANAHPWTNSVKPVLGEFQELTGIQIQEEDLPEAQFRQKLTTELSQGTGSVDVMMSAPAQEGLKYDQAGWYEPLDRFVQDPTLTAPDYDFADFSPRPIEMQTVNGKLIGIPVQLESTMIIYRKDLFEEKGIEAPATFADLEAAAQALHDPDNRLFGVGLRGKGAARPRSGRRSCTGSAATGSARTASRPSPPSPPSTPSPTTATWPATTARGGWRTTPGPRTSPSSSRGSWGSGRRLGLQGQRRGPDGLDRGR
jgi:ABC-type glycerol-3-phosphate transport system substrate-binding protein